MGNHVDLELVVKDVIEGFLSLRRMVENEHDNSPSIHKVHSGLRDLNPTFFDPRVVSIGPIHRNDANVQAFEARKVKYLDKLLDRVNSKKPDQRLLEECVQKVASSIDQIRVCYYDETVKNYDNSELTKMMVMDACFILEFINQRLDATIPGNKLLDRYITYDLVLLENQIPFFVLNHVFQCTMHHLVRPNTLLTEFISPTLERLNRFQTELKLTSIHPDTIHDHLLGVLHNCYKPQEYPISYFLSSTIPSVVELDRAGVNFKPINRDTQWPMAMGVKVHRIPCCSWSWRKTTFRMPVLCISDFTELVLRNLIAYEQSFFLSSRHHITSYVCAMDMLIDSQEDIAKLVESKVLVNHIGSNQEAANMINSICKQIVWVDFFYAQQWAELDRHCNGYWPRNIAWLKRTYFNNPWNIIALLAVIGLFVLTAVQTYFTVKPAGSNRWI